MVRGLVEEDEVGPRPDEPRQTEARALPTAQRAHLPVNLIAAKQEPAEEAPHLDLVRGGPQVPERVEDLGLRRQVGALLVQPRLLDPGTPFHLSLARRELPAQDAQERRLARAVSPHDAQPVAAHEIQRDPAE